MLEVDVNGVFVAGVLVWAVVAFLIVSASGRLLGRLGLYRIVWHRALFDFALFIIVWGGISAVAYRLAFPQAAPD